MEQTNEHPETLTEEHAPDKAFSSGSKKVERIAQQSKGLIDDVKDWIDLKIKLVELEIREEIKARQDDAIAYAVAGFLGVMALVFLLVAMALGFGVLFGHPAWGFLTVTAILVIVAGGLFAFRASKREAKSAKDEPKRPQVTAPDAQKQLPPGSISPDAEKGSAVDHA